MIKKKFDFPVGKKVKGYGLLNEFGEFDFFPEQTGSHPNSMKVIVDNPNFTIYRCKKKLKVVLNLETSQNRIELFQQFASKYNKVLNFLMNYEV